MIEHSALTPEDAARAQFVRLGTGARKPRTLFWTIIFATLASIGLWMLLAMAGSALLQALFGSPSP